MKVLQGTDVLALPSNKGRPRQRRQSIRTLSRSYYLFQVFRRGDGFA